MTNARLVQWTGISVIPPDYSIEIEHLRSGRRMIAGVDEAGRGPWAGPVVCAAVVIPENHSFKGLNDSKQLTLEQRNYFFNLINSVAMVGIGLASPRQIDSMNIRAATLWAMSEAVKSLPTKPDFVIVDGRDIPSQLPCAGQAVVKGDSLSLSIAAASVIAKVTRDRLMIQLAQEFPQYGFEKHKGYGTAQHSNAIAEHGVTEHHRKSYKPIREFLSKELGRENSSVQLSGAQYA